MSKISYILMFLFFITGGFLFSQEDDNWVQGKTIIDIEFEGLDNVDKNELNGVINNYIGEVFSDELFLELQTLMYELDYFDIIVPNAKPGDDSNETVIIVFKVQESPTISKIKFEGNSVWSTELQNSIVLKPKDIYSDFKLEQAQKALVNFYIDKGYSSATVDIEKDSDPEKNSLIVTFNINEGVQTLIREINFNGNNIFTTDKKLRALIETKKKSLFKDGVYRVGVIQSDVLLIEGLYHNSGYIKAKVLDVKTTLTDDEKDPEIKNMVIDIFLEEGDVYTYGGISYAGNKIFTDVEFDAFDFMDYGAVYNKSKHEGRFIKIQSLYYDNGYIENSFHDEIEIDEENKVISHVISIRESGIAHIGKISVRGNEKTKDIVILREILIEPGDVFSRKEVWSALSNIMSTSIFTNVVPQLEKTEDGNMDLVFEVEEARTLTLMGGITVTGADFEPALTFSLKDLNFMGMGRTFGGTLNLGLDTQSFSLEYNEPRIFNTEFFGGGSLSFTHSEEDMLELAGEDSEGLEYPILTGISSFEEYEAWEDEGNEIDEDEEDLHQYDISLAISGGHLWYTDLGRVRASSGYSISLDTYVYDNDFVPYETEYRERESEEWEFSDKWWARGVLDNRDSPVGTTEGYGFSQGLTIGGILPLDSESHYIKTVSNADVYFKLVDTPVNEDWDFILSLRLHGAYTRIFEKPGYDLLDADKTAKIDGMFVGRGWSSEGSGTALLDLKVELNIPIVPNMFGSTFFFDAANVWTDDEDEGTLDIDDFKFSFGGSIGITNQIMPISFFIAKTFQTEDGDINWSPESEYNKIFDDNLTWGISFNLNYLLN
ncbi:MAG: outer membrane protein assembly factor BamA [Spirochaetaceae bacterium]